MGKSEMDTYISYPARRRSKKEIFGRIIPFLGFQIKKIWDFSIHFCLILGFFYVWTGKKFRNPLAFLYILYVFSISCVNSQKYSSSGGIDVLDFSFFFCPIQVFMAMYNFSINQPGWENPGINPETQKKFSKKNIGKF